MNIPPILVLAYFGVNSCEIFSLLIRKGLASSLDEIGPIGRAPLSTIVRSGAAQARRYPEKDYI
jgi:hypothetical protein